MKAPLRRVGNSLGIIIPRAILQSWNVREGDALGTRLSIGGRTAIIQTQGEGEV